MRSLAFIIYALASCSPPYAETTDGLEPTTSTSTTTTTGSSSTGEPTTTAPMTGDTSSTSTTGPIETCSHTLCDDLAAWCHGYRITDAICETIAEKICPGNPCAACDIAASRCVFGDVECEKEATDLCYGAAACDCAYRCDVTADMLPEVQRTALCYTTPWTIGKWCSEPDEGLCLSVMASDCAPTACEYAACMEALKREPCSIPGPCEAINACLHATG